MHSEFAHGTRHSVVTAQQAQALPNLSIVLPVKWPTADGQKFGRPIWREEDGSWSDGRTSVPWLVDFTDYFLLYVPRPPLPEVGAQLAEHELDLLPAQAVVRDAQGWTAQLMEDPDSTDRRLVWIGPLNAGDHWNHDALWDRAGERTGIWLVWLPEQEQHRRADIPSKVADHLIPEDVEDIGDGPEEYER